MKKQEVAARVDDRDAFRNAELRRFLFGGVHQHVSALAREREPVPQDESFVHASSPAGRRLRR